MADINVSIISLIDGVPNKDQPSGVMGFCSWSRLIDQLRQTGEIGHRETITHFIVSESGLQFRVERAP